MRAWHIFPTPEAGGVSSKGLLAYLDAVERSGLEHHAILVLRKGQVVCRMNFAPYEDQTPHILFSLSKSFTSAAAGFAVSEGLLRWEDRVLDVLPDKAPQAPSEWLRQVTLRHLLTMGSGLAPQSDRAEGADWARASLACGCDHAPGTHFHYNSLGTYLISCMVQRATGMTVRDYLIPRLFAPLGIPAPEWDLCPQGVCAGGWGLHLSCDSIARFGQCLLDGGVWEGKRVLPEEWLSLATQKQIENSDDPENQSEWGQGYGFQFWRCRENRFRGDGMFGQLCLVDRALEMVVAVTAGIEDMAEEMALIHDHLFPAAQMAPGTPEEQARLRDRLAALSYPWPENDASGALPGGEYADDALRLGLTPEREGMTLTLTPKGRKTVHFRLGLGTPLETIAPADIMPGAPAVRYLGACGWKNGKLQILLRTVEGPFTLHAQCALDAAGMEIDMHGAGFPRKKGRLEKDA